MAARRTERLLNLLIALLHTRSFLTAERIREIVAGYDEAPSDEAFKRMFERDKEDLRELGVPLETGLTPVEEEQGYRVSRADYALPELTFAPDEAAALGLAARMWTTAALGPTARRALRKLESAGLDLVELPEGLQPRLEADSAVLPVLSSAVRDGRVVTFGYRRPSDPEQLPRRVEPWGVVWWHGRWYLVGHDLDRADTRVFRLSRVVGEPVVEGPSAAVSIPADVDLRTLVSRADPERTPERVTLRVRSGRAHGLRRRATEVAPDPESAQGWDRLVLDAAEPDHLVEEILRHGADIVVLSPDRVRTNVVERLRTLAQPPTGESS